MRIILTLLGVPYLRTYVCLVLHGLLCSVASLVLVYLVSSVVWFCGVTYVTVKRLDIPLYAWYDGLTKSGNR